MSHDKPKKKSPTKGEKLAISIILLVAVWAIYSVLNPPLPSHTTTSALNEFYIVNHRECVTLDPVNGHSYAIYVNITNDFKVPITYQSVSVQINTIDLSDNSVYFPGRPPVPIPPSWWTSQGANLKLHFYVPVSGWVKSHPHAETMGVSLTFNVRAAESGELGNYTVSPEFFHIIFSADEPDCY
jgi:hypothetical protein